MRSSIPWVISPQRSSKNKYFTLNNPRKQPNSTTLNRMYCFSKPSQSFAPIPPNNQTTSKHPSSSTPTNPRRPVSGIHLCPLLPTARTAERECYRCFPNFCKSQELKAMTSYLMGSFRFLQVLAIALQSEILS